MNTMQFSFAAFGLVLIFGVYSGDAIKCYICNSGKEYQKEACATLENEDFLMDCAEYADKNHEPIYKNATLCRKMAQTVEGESRIVRSCAVEGRIDRCVERTGTKSVKVTYCQCEGDGCNSASSIIASVLLLVAALFFTRS